MHATNLSIMLHRTLPIDTLPINNTTYLSHRRSQGASTDPTAVSLAPHRSPWSLCSLPGPSAVYLAPQRSPWPFSGLPGPSVVFLVPLRSPWPFSGLPGPSAVSLALQWSPWPISGLPVPSVCFLSQCVAGHVCTCAG